MTTLRDPKIVTLDHNGFEITVDVRQGHLMVRHGGDITWDQLAEIKTLIWGPDARAIEVYPADSQIVNNANIRHLWMLGPNDFCPDLLGDDNHHDSLQSRVAVAWAEARA